MTIAYDGTEYGGWQTQHNATCIQDLIQQALSTFLRHPVAVIGSGRTDAGVHALGQVAHFTHFEPLDFRKTLFALNSLLPSAIRILNIEAAPADFHARYSAKSKIYHYHLHLSPILDPFQKLYRYQVFHPVNRSLLTQAAQIFIGTHDFTSFANEGHQGPAAKDAERTLYRLDIVEQEGGVRLELEGDGFLYKMVRNIVGTLLDISSGKIPVEALPCILAAKDRKQAGRAAPAHGLFLVQVNYSETVARESKCNAPNRAHSPT